MATGFFGRYHRNKRADQPQCMFSNPTLCGKLGEAVIFVCEEDPGGEGTNQ